MAVTIEGTRIVFNESNDSITLNCPIKSIKYVGGTAAEVKIDNLPFYLGGANEGVKFHSLNGYPGVQLAVGTLNARIVVNIEEIGDVLNPNYFKEDIRNWNGQGATASVSETESKARSRTKKAEVSE